MIMNHIIIIITVQNKENWNKKIENLWKILLKYWEKLSSMILIIKEQTTCQVHTARLNIQATEKESQVLKENIRKNKEK